MFGLEAIYVPSLIIGGTMAAASSAVSVATAQSQNAAIGRSMAANSRNANQRSQDLITRRDAMSSQVLDQRRISHLQQMRQANAVQGRARAAAAMSGSSTGSGSAMRAVEQVRTDRLFNQMNLDANVRSQLMGINTQYLSGYNENLASFDAIMAQLQSQAMNPTLFGIQSGISGLGTGLSISGGLGMPGPIRTSPSTTGAGWIRF